MEIPQSSETSNQPKGSKHLECEGMISDWESKVGSLTGPSTNICVN